MFSKPQKLEEKSKVWFTLEHNVKQKDKTKGKTKE